MKIPPQKPNSRDFTDSPDSLRRKKVSSAPLMAAATSSFLAAAALFSFFLSPTPARSQDKIPEPDLLLRVKRSLAGSEIPLATWRPGIPPCGEPPDAPGWAGVKCQNGAVTTLRLVAMGLSGAIDLDALERLTSLRALSLVNNSFTGPLPEFNRLGGLKTLFLSENRFDGEIPENYFENLSSLKKLWLDGNAFTGDIPASLRNLTKIIVLHLENNRFTGPIPDFNRLNHLKLLFISNNRFSGEIPDDFFLNQDNLRKFWLGKNRFTGNLPKSLSNLTNIIELHLDNNNFTGQIPNLPQESLIDLDLSGNSLSGRVPAAMERFDARAFAGNAALCGENLPEKCPDEPEQEQEEESRTDRSNEDNNNAGMMIAALSTILAMILSLLLIIIIFRKVKSKAAKQSNQTPKVRRGNTIGSVAAQMAATLGRSGRKTGIGSARRTAAALVAKRRARAAEMGDLVMLNDEKGRFGLPDLMKASAEILGNAGVGSTYKAVMSNGLSVVVKRMRDSNGKDSKEFDTEAKRIGNLRHDNVLSPLSYYYRSDEKLFVYEYVAKGSLFYQLHGDHGSLNWTQRLKIVKGIAKGMCYLHKALAPSPLPHGNLKSSNIFLGNDFNPLLAEFGFIALFGPKVAAQMLVAFKSPEGIQHGKVSPKSDVFCVGIIILEIVSGKLPTLATNRIGGTDLDDWTGPKGKLTDLMDSSLASSTSSVESVLEIAKDCIATDPDDRLDMEEALKRIETIQA